MIMTMPKRKSVAPTDGRSDRYKPISSGKIAIWADEFQGFADMLKLAAKHIHDHDIDEVSFDGACGFDEVVDRIGRAFAQAMADVKKTIRNNRSAKA